MRRAFFALLLLACAPARGAITFLESGTDATSDLAAFSSTAGTVASATDQVHVGPRSVKFSTGAPAAAATASRTGALADAGRRISFWLRFDALPAGTNPGVLEIQQAGGTVCYRVQINSSGQLRNIPVGVTVGTGSTLAVNTWYRISVAYVVTSASDFEFRVYLNGILDTTRTEADGTMTNVSTSTMRLGAPAVWGDNVNVWIDSIYVDDVADLSDPGAIRVTAKLPNEENATGWDSLVGAARGASDYNSVNERPLSETNGWVHRGVAFVNAATLATNATTTTLTMNAPTCAVNDILIAFIYGNNVQVVSPPDGSWTSISEADCSGSSCRHSIFWKRATATCSGTFAFTKPTDDNLLFAGLIASWSGVRTDGNPIDGTATSSPNASSDTVTYATYDPGESTSAFVIAAGFYDNDQTTAGAFSGTDPTMTNRVDVETNVGDDCSIFVYDGLSTGAATGSRTHSTTSTADAVNNGVLFGLVPQALENYTLQAAGTGDVNIASATIVGYGSWAWAKISSTSGSPAVGVMNNGSTTGVTLSTSSTYNVTYTASASYPSNAAGTGMRSAGNAATTTYYEGGTLVAYIPSAVAPRNPVVIQ